MKKALLILTIAVLSACTNYKFPDNSETNQNPLTVGQVTLLITKSDIASMPIDKYTWGMTIHVKNLADNKTIEIPVESQQGYFYTFALPPGSFHIKKIVFKSETGSIWVDPSKKDTFSVSGNAVNNMGNLLWTSNIPDSERKTIFFTEHSKIKAFFGEKNKHSEWMNKPWIDVKQKPL